MSNMRRGEKLMGNLDAAIALACRVHAGQLDKSGQPYIMHPLRLMLKFSCEEEKIVAVLHDVIEDDNVGIEELRLLGLTEIVIDAIKCISRKPSESYEDFIRRVSANELAKK